MMQQSENTTTQAFYTKAAAADSVNTASGTPTPSIGSPTPTTPSNIPPSPGSAGVPPQNKKGKNSMGRKKLYAMVGILLFVLVAGMGVFIALRQSADESVAPTAPTSQPSATRDALQCTLNFTVDAPTGNARCEYKEAHTAFLSENTDTSVTTIPAGSTVERGEEIVYRIAISADELTSGDVLITDALPEGVEFVESDLNTPEVVYNADTHTVTANLGQLNGTDTTCVDRDTNRSRDVTTNDRTARDQEQSTRERSTREGTSGTRDGSTTRSGETRNRTRDESTNTSRTTDDRVRGVTDEVAQLAQVDDRTTDQRTRDEQTGDQRTRDERTTRESTGTETTRTRGTRTDGRSTNTHAGCQDGFIIVEFLVKVTDSTQIEKIQNVAIITTSGQNQSSCNTKHYLPPTGVAQCVAKEAHTAFIADDSQEATYMAPDTVVELGDQFVYRITVRPTATTSTVVEVLDQLPSQLAFVDHQFNSNSVVYDQDTRTVSADLGQLECDQVSNEAGGPSANACRSTIVEFMVKVVNVSKSGAFTNSAIVSTGETELTCAASLIIDEEEITPSPSPSVSPSPSPSSTPPAATFSCNANCLSDAQCQSANANYICSAEHGNTCRLDSNRDSSSCQPPVDTYACNSACSTDAQCQTVSGSYVCSNGSCRLGSNQPATNCQPVVYNPPPPTVGCNESCVSNSDCANSAHICYSSDSSQSGVCRLAEYVNSDTCTTPVETIAYTTTVAQEQPVLPEVLPESGPAEWIDWLKAGLVTLGLGAALLLLL